MGGARWLVSASAVAAAAMLVVPASAIAAPPVVGAITFDPPLAPVVGRTVTATVTVMSGPRPTITYRWLRCTADQCNETIGDATPAYTPVAADAGHPLALEVTATSPAGTDTKLAPTEIVQAPPDLTSVAIVGDPVVRQTLTADVIATGVPAPTVTYEWLRCAIDSASECGPIEGATDRTYLVADADAGHRLALRARAANTVGDATGQSLPTAAVTSGPSFDQSGALGATAVGPASSSVRRLRYLRPFPIVRIKGYLTPGGARITLLRVRAPRGSRVIVRCSRSGCPLRERSVRVGRIRALERYLPAGTRITIRVFRRGLVGKHVRIVIRKGRAPVRRDACLLPGHSAAARCPRP